MEIFQGQVGGEFATLNLIDCDVEILSDNMKGVLISTSIEMLENSKAKK